MIIELSRVPDGGEQVEGEESADILKLGDVSGLTILSPICYRFRVELVSGELVVRGTLALRAAFDCNRCARRFEKEIRVPDFICVRECRELAEAIDLTEDMREDMILAFPNYPVCSSGCRGLCPLCGVDLNEKTCSCRPPADNSAWDALDQIKRRME